MEPIECVVYDAMGQWNVFLESDPSVRAKSEANMQTAIYAFMHVFKEKCYPVPSDSLFRFRLERYP